MERHAFYTRLVDGQTDAYTTAHRNMPPPLIAAYREAGIGKLHIFRDGNLLFLYLECENMEAANATLNQNPLELQWQKLMSPMLEGGDFRLLHEIFELP